MSRGSWQEPPATTPDTRVASPWQRRRLLSLPSLLSLALAAALIVFLVARFDIDLGAILRRLRSANLGLFFLAVAVHYLSFLFRGARWHVLLSSVRTRQEARLSVWHASVLVLLSWFANSITFFRLGDAYRAYMYTEDTGASFSRTMGTVLSERVVDVTVVFVLLAAAAFGLSLGPARLPAPLVLLLALGMVAVSVGVLGGMFLVRARIVRLLPRPLAAVYERFYQGAVGSLRQAQLRLVFLLGLLGWLCEVGRLYLVLLALGIDLRTAWVVFVTLANAILTLVPATPGGLGVVESGITGLLALSMPLREAVSVAILDRSISYGSVLVGGGAVLLARHVLRGAAAGRSAERGAPRVEWR